MEWPKLGGTDLVVAPTNLFISDQFRDTFDPGEERAIYVAACPGLAIAAKQIAPLYKPGVTSPERVPARVAELKRDEYGAYRMVDGEWIKGAGYNEWYASHLYPLQLPSPGSPVTARPRSIHVRLPAGMTTEAFDARVGHAAIDRWMETPEGRMRCMQRGLNPDAFRFATQYPGWIFAPAREICVMTIYAGADRLVAVAEQIIAQHLGLEWRRFDAK